MTKQPSLVRTDRDLNLEVYSEEGFFADLEDLAVGEGDFGFGIGQFFAA